MLLDVDGVTMRFGGITALNDVSFHVDEDEICGLIGPNGAGKTTLFNCLSRLYTPQEGRITFDGQELLKLPVHAIADLGIARTFQNLGLFPNLPVLYNVMLGAHTRTKVGFLRSVVFTKGVTGEERQIYASSMEILHRLDLAEFAFHPAQGLPFGILKRVEMARALAMRPRLLLLDEPASGLSHGEVDGLVDHIRGIKEAFDVTILLVEHHMGFVMQLSDRVVVLDFGRKIAEGTPAEVQSDEKVIEAYLGVAT